MYRLFFLFYCLLFKEMKNIIIVFKIRRSNIVIRVIMWIWSMDRSVGLNVVWSGSMIRCVSVCGIVRGRIISGRVVRWCCLSINSVLFIWWVIFCMWWIIFWSDRKIFRSGRIRWSGRVSWIGRISSSFICGLGRILCYRICICFLCVISFMFVWL